MASVEKIVPFILQAEGGYVDDKDDMGGATNKGVTWKTWCSLFDASTTHDRFMIMSAEDWTFIFKNLYWNQIMGDQINSQKVADVIVDWAYNSGRHTASVDIQDILIHIFGEHLDEDGVFGAATIKAINEQDADKLFDDIIQKRLDFYNQICISHPTNQKFLQGWKNRITNLIKFES